MTCRNVRILGVPRCAGLLLVLVAILGLLAQGTFAQVQGLKQTERLVKSANKTVDAIASAKNQIRATLAAYNAIMKDGVEDRRKAYKSLVKAIDKSDSSVMTVRTRGTDMNAEANQFFADWGKSVESIASEDVKVRAQARLDESRQRFTEILEKGRVAGNDYEAFMTALRDQVLYLGHDLNPSGVASVSEDAKKLNQQADELFGKIDETILAYREYTSDLQPE